MILGGGPAGLGAAYRLATRQAFQVTLLERGSGLGGNAGSFELAGIPVDFGSHRLHPSCDPGVLSDIRRFLGDDLLERPRHGRIRLQGRWIRFPLRPLDLALRLPPSFILGVGRDALRRLWARRPRNGTETFESVMRASVGNTIGDHFYFPYARKIWGLEPGELSPIQARRRVSAGSLTALVKKATSGLRPSAGPAGRSFFYPRRGFGQIATAYGVAAERSGATLLRGASVTRVTRTGGIWRVDFEHPDGARFVEADQIWSTIPLTALVRSLHPPAPQGVLESAGAISFRAMILIYLVLARPRFSEFDAHYFPGPDVALSRLSEPRNYSAAVEPRDRTVLCGELPCSPQGRLWSLSDEELGREMIRALDRADLPPGSGVTQVVTRRLRHAYPIYELGYERHFDRLQSWIDAQDNLISFGRQGLFAHDNTHHALRMAYAAGDCLDDRGHFDRARWRRCLEEFKSHVVED